MQPIENGIPLEKQAKIHLKTFLAQRADMVELAHSAIYLLRTVPAARAAVLEYMQQVFDCAVEKNQSDNNADSPPNSVVIQQLHQTLYSLVKSSPAVWAPLVSPWSLQLLGYLSSKYADKRSTNLGEVMQLWMSCAPMRSLIDLTSHCMVNAVDSDTDKCINALLDTTIRYSPHFDWVIAHIGSSFPHTVITRVLAVGLKHFMNAGRSQPTGLESNKLVSVVGILGHLAGQHSSDIKKALADMIADSLQEQPTAEQLAVIPYLIELCLMSELLLTSVVGDLPFMLNKRNLNILASHSELWLANNMPSMNNTKKLLVELFLRCGRNEHEALALLSLALRIKQGRIDGVDSAIIKFASLFLNCLIDELQKRVYAKASVPLLVSFELHAKELLNQLDLTCPWTIRFMSLICLHCSEKMRFLVEMLTTKTDPSLFIQIMNHIETSHPTVIVDTLNALIVELRSGRVSDPILVLHNLRQLVAMEPRAQKTLWKFADTLSLHSSECNLEYTAEIVRLLGICGLPIDEIPESILYKIICAASVVFFAGARMSDDQEKKAEFIGSALRLYHVSCSNNLLAQQMSIRLLLDGVTESTTSKLFGAIPKNCERVPKTVKMTSLLEENRKIVASINFPQSHSSIMRAGVVGDGLRAGRWLFEEVLDSHLIRQNQKCFIKTLKVCCGSKFKAKGLLSIATILCDIINPDVMYNSPVWPSEDILKATQEKDVEICESFKANPILWQVLTFVATEDPTALEGAAILIRSLLGCQMTFWKNSQDSYVNPEQKDITVRVISLMGLGKMIPSPLADISLIVDHLIPYHLYCLLNDIWSYMCECSGTLQEEQPVPARFTTNLRIIMLHNIDKVANKYAKMFPVS